jgi:hypothetical protein
LTAVQRKNIGVELSAVPSNLTEAEVTAAGQLFNIMLKRVAAATDPAALNEL